jgi:hypothetical protein
MDKPLVVSLPHQRGLSTLSSQFGAVIVVKEENWRGHNLDFKINALKQDLSGTIEVGGRERRILR